MNPLSEIEKDAKQFRREPRTLLLMGAVPLLILLITALIFGGQPGRAAGTSEVGVCDMDGSDASALFVAGIANASRVVEIRNASGCGPELEAGVRDGRLAAGLVVPEGFGAGIEGGESQNVSLLLDNSRFQVSPAIEALVKASVEQTDQRIGTQFISSVWARLDEARARLDNMRSDTNETRERATRMRLELNRTAASLAAIDIAGARSQVAEAGRTVDEGSLAIDKARDNLTLIGYRLETYDQALEETEGDLVSINASLGRMAGNIQESKAAVNCSRPEFVAYCLTLDSFQAAIDPAQAAMEKRISKVSATRADLGEANRTVREFGASLDQARLGARDAGRRLSNMTEFVEQLEENRRESLATLQAVDASLAQTIEKTREFDAIIDESRGAIADITSRPPAFVISPMVVGAREVFGPRPYFEFMLPSLMPLILMFVALFLASAAVVREKNSGTLTRVSLSQVNPVEYAAVKVLSLTVVLLPEAILLGVMASVLYSAFPISDLLAWFSVMQTLSLLIFAFVAVGVLIAVYSESEATAFLASLVVGLPMLFLSGLLFPLELMPAPISALASLSPLTQAVAGMEGAMIYHAPQVAPALMLLAYGVIFALAAGASLRRRI